MTKSPTGYDRYRYDHERFRRQVASDSPGWIQAIQDGGLETFNSVEFPTATRGNEKWKYTNVGPVARKTFEYPFEPHDGYALEKLLATVPRDDNWANLVFVDGRFDPEWSSNVESLEGVTAGNLHDLLTHNGRVGRKHLGRYAADEINGFAAVNTAFVRDGAFVHVPEGSVQGTVLHLVFVSTARPRPTVAYPRTLIIANRNSAVTVLESFVGEPGSSYFTNAVAEIVVEEGADLEHYRYMMESANAHHIGTTWVDVACDGKFRSISLATGAAIARNELEVRLMAPGASCDVRGIYVTHGKQHIDNHIDIDHASPHTSSDQYFKGILDDHSRAVFSGRVLVRRDAQKSYASQADKNLMLSKGARVNTKPSMEIFADDVQCSHGATAGAVTDDSLLYMRSRGIEEKVARNLLVHGFASEIIDGIKLEPLRDHMDRIFSDPRPGSVPGSIRQGVSADV